MTRPPFHERNQRHAENQFTVTCDSVSPVAIVARASKTTNSIAARGLRMAVVFVASAFIHICKMSSYKLDSERSEDKIVFAPARYKTVR